MRCTPQGAETGPRAARLFRAFFFLLAGRALFGAAPVDHLIQAVNRVGKAAQGIDQALLDGVPALQDRADIQHELARVHHQLGKAFRRNAAVCRNEPRDALLHALEIVHRLRHAHEHPVHAHGMDGHRGRRHDEAAAGGNGQRHADAVAAAEDQAHGGLFHARDELGQGQARLDVAADGIQQDQKPVDLRFLFNGHKLRDHVLIARRLRRARQDGMALDLADNRQAVDRVAARTGHDAAGVADAVLLQIGAAACGDSSSCMLVSPPALVCRKGEKVYRKPARRQKTRPFFFSRRFIIPHIPARLQSIGRPYRFD